MDYFSFAWEIRLMIVGTVINSNIIKIGIHRSGVKNSNTDTPHIIAVLVCERSTSKKIAINSRPASPSLVRPLNPIPSV